MRLKAHVLAQEEVVFSFHTPLREGNNILQHTRIAT